MTDSAQNLDLGVVGNGAVAALIDANGAVAWLSMPRFDGAPIFNALLSGKGAFAIELANVARSTQYYMKNTAVLVTELEDKDGAGVRITDFAPRFQARGRMFRPASIVRQVEPIGGAPRIRVRLAPQANWSGDFMTARRGVSHLSYAADDWAFRVTTDAPVSYVHAGTEFILNREFSFICGPDEPLTEAADVLAREWREHTLAHWRNWARRLAVPFEWQSAVIRAAITLKMCVFEETGGIVAALTTSIPESANSGRNWDYRYCWLRDAYFTVSALNRLSAVGTLEHYLLYLRNIVAHTEGRHIQPVYGISLEPDLKEEIVEGLPGYRGMGPVRRGNQAAGHIQHDVYGHVVLGATQAFFDERLIAPAGEEEFRHLEKVGERAYAVFETPDAGIWEYRGRACVHTSSAFMCWAACDRLSKIAARLKYDDRAKIWAKRAGEIKKVVLGKAWSEKRQTFTGAFGGEAIDASVVLMAEVGFLPASDPRFIATVERIDQELREGYHVFRYREADDFGAPKTAFTACTFWHIDALARIGRVEEARAMFEDVLANRNSLGLLSEDIDTKTGELWGNYPQTYSMVGIINVAARLSARWENAV
ncbi:MAG TPA: glycoside hydrolase family 15 protein [Parvularculaceae bacterium]|nr:glycoside hydrolase family 15 protein [Parvularculaceae bacterium]